MYAYCDGNPVAYCDPTGMNALSNFLIGVVTVFRNVLPTLFESIRTFWSGVFANDKFWSGLGSLMKDFPSVTRFFLDVFASMFRYFDNLEIKWSTGTERIRNFFSTIGKLFKGDGLFAWFASLFKKQPKGKIPNYTLDQERIDTFALQDKCFALLAGDYTKGKWDLCTTETQKKNFMNGLFNAVQGIMNTSIDKASSSSAINWESLSNPNARGGYDARPGNKITLNVDWLNGIDGYDLVYTIIHEARHAFQQEAVLGLNSHVVCKDTIDAWAKNLPEGKSGAKPPYYAASASTDVYMTQAIEWDAKCFSKQYEDLIDGYINDYYILDSYSRAYPGIWGEKPVRR